MLLNIATIITDLIHILKIILLCELLVVFEKYRDNRKYFIVCMASVIVSQIIYCRDADIFSVIIYTGLIFIVINLIYVIKLWQSIFLSFSLMFLSSMIDTMSNVMIDLIFNICNMSEFMFKEFIAAMVSMLLVLVLLFAYKRKYQRRYSWINVKNSAFFTILVLVEVMIVLAIVAVYKNGIMEENKRLFAIMAILVIIGMLLQLGTVFLLYSANSIYVENDALMKKYLNDQKKHYEYLEIREEETKKFRHDVRNHMQMLYYLQKKGQYEEIDKYLEL